MTSSNARTASSIFLVCGALIGASGCAGSRAPGEPANSSARTAEEPAPEASAAGADIERQEAPEPGAGAWDQEAPAPAEEAEADELGPFQDGSQKKKESARMLQNDLGESVRSLEGMLDAEQLSCNSAKPHQDAICAIAERICELAESTSFEDQKHCVSARKKCTDAKKRFAEKCG